MEVFMDDFSVHGTSFDYYMHNLSKVLQRCKDVNVVEVIEKLAPLTYVKGAMNFLRHVFF